MIRRFVLAAALLIPIAAIAQTAGEPFTIALPTGFAAFAKSSQTADSPDGKIQTTNWVSKSPDGQAVIVAVSKMPAKILAPAKLINSTRDGLVKSLKATVDNEQPMAGDHPATNFMLHSQGAWVRAHLMVIGDTLYQVVYVGHSDAQRNAAPVAQMFDSFKTL